jgi:fatty acid desaturase
MAQLSDEDYEAEKKNVTRYHNILEMPVITFLFLGIITAGLNLTVGGFTPIVWFVLSFWCVLVIICMEVTMIRTTQEINQLARSR